MTWQWTPFSSQIVLMVAVLTVAAIYIWLRHDWTDARAGQLLIPASLVWLAGSVLQTLSADLVTKFFWSKVQYAVIIVAPVAWLIYALQYRERHDLVTRRNLVLLGLVPLAALLLIFTNELHHLMWTDVSLKILDSYAILDVSFGPAFWGLMAYTAILIVLGLVLISQTFGLMRRFFGHQVTLMQLACLAPLLAGVVDIFGGKPFPLPNLSPLVFTVSNLVVTKLLYRLRVGAILPLARETVVEGMSDAVIVLDTRKHVIDLNPAARELAGRTASEVIGRSIEDVWPNWAQWIGNAHAIILDKRGRQHAYDVRVSPLADNQNQPGIRVAVLREVTGRRLVEQSLRQSVAELENLQRITEALLSLEDLAPVMKAVAEGIVTQLGFDVVLASRYVEEENVFTGLALYPMPADKKLEPILKLIGRSDLKDAPTQFRVPYQRGENPKVDRVLDGEVVIGDSLADFFHPWVPRSAAATAQRLFNIQTYVDLPMRVKDKTVGTMVAGVRRAPISPEQLQALARVADQAAVALENARLYESARRQSEELARANAFITALSQVAARVESTSAPDQIWQVLGAELRKLGLVCMVLIADADDSVVIRYLSVESAFLAMGEKLLGRKAIGHRTDKKRMPAEVFEQGQAVFYDDPLARMSRAMPKVPLSVLRRLVQLGGVSPDSALIYLPLAVEGRVLGCIVVSGEDLKRDDIPAFSVFAGQVAAALKNARLYEQAQNEIAERMRAEAEIQASLKEKEVLLQEIHHRVKNNLQVISSLLSLQSEQVQDSQALEIFRDSQTRVRSMALIHEKLYRSENLAQIDFAAYIQDLTSFLFRSYGRKAGNIALSIEADEVFLGIDTAVPCGLLLNELISNALKHAFPPASAGGSNGTNEIRVELAAGSNGCVSLTVGDNGVGLAPGIDFYNSPSLGLQLVNSLAMQLEAAIQLDGGPGTRVKITFAVPESRR